MGSLVLVRHATTTASQAGTNLGQATDLPLTADGQVLAARLGRAIALELAALAHTEVRLVSSPARRCLDTAAAIQEALPIDARPGVVPEAGLREIDYGAWEGLPSEECRRRDPELRAAWEADPYATATPGGESGGDVAARAFPVLEPIEDWLDASRERAAVVVAHNHVLRLRLAALTGIPLADYRRRFVVQPGSYSIVTLGGGRRTIRRIGVLPPSA
ncbi:MAG TPA: histidine phosphatase family protein [Candidatus Limnocylindria bacterium]